MSAHGGPDLITNGLVMQLDAANPKSYLGTGTAWLDLCGNYNFSITNSPTFGLHNNTPCFSFVQSNDYALYSGSLKHDIASACTLQIVLASIGSDNLNVHSGCSRLMAMGDTSSSADYQFFYCLAACDAGKYGLWYNDAAGGFGGFYPTTNMVTADNMFRIITVTWRASGRAQYYVNSILENDRAAGTTFNNANVSRIVLGANNSLGENSYVRIAYVSMYNRQLSNAEILLNYNVLKSRFRL
jgi:hypothetical protein